MVIHMNGANLVSSLLPWGAPKNSHAAGEALALAAANTQLKLHSSFSSLADDNTHAPQHSKSQ